MISQLKLYCHLFYYIISYELNLDGMTEDSNINTCIHYLKYFELIMYKAKPACYDLLRLIMDPSINYHTSGNKVNKLKMQKI